MAQGDWNPADDRDTWLRVIVDSSYVKKDGNLHNRAFKGRAVQPPTANKPWAFEASGKLLSLTANIDEAGEVFVERIRRNKPNAEFVGVAFAKVEDICKAEPPTYPRVSVAITPIPDVDEAHADVVAFDDQGREDVAQSLRDWLQENLIYRPREKVKEIEDQRVDFLHDANDSASVQLHSYTRPSLPKRVWHVLVNAVRHAIQAFRV